MISVATPKLRMLKNQTQAFAGSYKSYNKPSVMLKIVGDLNKDFFNAVAAVITF